MPIRFFNEDIKFELKQKNLLRKWIKDSIDDSERIIGDINIIFTSDKYLLSLNKEYLSHNYFTDIVTFNYCDESILNGDIFISIETVKNNSEQFGVRFIEEVHRVIIHGILHLIGFDDKNEEEKTIMREKENFYLKRLKNLS